MSVRLHIFLLIWMKLDVWVEVDEWFTMVWHRPRFSVKVKVTEVSKLRIVPSSEGITSFRIWKVLIGFNSTPQCLNFCRAGFFKFLLVSVQRDLNIWENFTWNWQDVRKVKSLWWRGMNGIWVTALSTNVSSSTDEWLHYQLMSVVRCTRRSRGCHVIVHLTDQKIVCYRTPTLKSIYSAISC